MIFKVIKSAYKNLEGSTNILLEDVTITENNEVIGYSDKHGYQQIHIRFTKDFEIALVKCYDDGHTLKGIEIYRWDRYERCYCKAEYA